LPDLIASTLEQYEDIAIQLATHPQAMKDIRQRLFEKRHTAPLYNTPLYCRHLESAFSEIYTRYLAGARPEHLKVESGSLD
jgi:predicted O-linked N-acetylglucosamine transferase (SPINDLY family)